MYDYQFSSVPIHFTIIDPQGNQEKKEIDLQLKDDSGEDLGQCSVDICDLDYTLEENVKLQKGRYKVVVSHGFEGPYLPNILGIGLKVEEVGK